MLSKEDIDSLPDDPEEAFAALADLFEAYVVDRVERRNGIPYDDAIGCVEEIQAVVSALGADDHYPRLMASPPRDDGGPDFWN